VKTTIFLVLSLIILSILFPFQIVSSIHKPDVQNLDITWYYDYLTSEDRKKIRQAIDYAIPREQIVMGLCSGYGEYDPSPIGKNNVGIYDETIKLRSYNVTKARELLTEVFGKRYNILVNNETHTTNPYFSMTLIGEVINSRRCQYYSLITRQLREIGINVTLKWWFQDTINSRIFNAPISKGFDYNHMGFDALIIGDGYRFPYEHPSYKEHSILDFFYGDFYQTTTFPPGCNFIWLENKQIESIWSSIYTSPDSSSRVKGLKDYQSWHYENVPVSIILKEVVPYPIRGVIQGVDPLFCHNFWNWSKTYPGTNDSITFLSGSNIENLNPCLREINHDDLIRINCYRALAERRGQYNITHAVPVISDSWTHNEDFLIWDIKLKEGIKFSDGTELTADDVVFTYQACMNNKTGSPYKDILVSILDNPQNIVKVNEYGLRFILPKRYPYVETILFNLPILSKNEMKTIPLEQWHTDETNLMRCPVGVGPYNVTSISNESKYQQAVLTALESYNGSQIGYNPAAVGGGIFFQEPCITEVVIIGNNDQDYDEILTNFQTGLYDAVDRNRFGISFEYILEDLNNTQWKILRIYNGEWHQLAYNHYSPIWGMNPGNPRFMYFETYNLERGRAFLDSIGVFIGLILLPFIRKGWRRI
jgi:ABC-type transport system substrate-binding protein